MKRVLVWLGVIVLFNFTWLTLWDLIFKCPVPMWFLISFSAAFGFVLAIIEYVYFPDDPKR